MDKRQEDGEGGENIDEPVHNQGNESDGSNEFLKEENNFKDMNISIEDIDKGSAVNDGGPQQDRNDVEVLQGGRPLHHHPISTSVSGRCKKYSENIFPVQLKYTVWSILEYPSAIHLDHFNLISGDGLATILQVTMSKRILCKNIADILNVTEKNIVQNDCGYSENYTKENNAH